MLLHHNYLKLQPNRMHSNELMGKRVLTADRKNSLCFCLEDINQMGGKKKTLADSTQIPGTAGTHPFACHSFACFDVLCQVDFPERAFGNVA